MLKKKVAIVSTTEELSYPVGKNRALAKKIDALAKKAKVAVVGTGVNPGFAMDALPITLTGICERVDSIRVDRIQDARTRRLPFQQKIGSGLTTEQFAQKVKDGSVRHVGLAESVTMIADAMGWKLDKVTDEIQPKIAEQAVESELIAVDPGYVCGIIQDGIGYVKGKPVITLHMEAYLGAPGVVRRGHGRGQSAHHAEDHRRPARRHRHGLDHRQQHPEDPARHARPADHGRHADSELVRRLNVRPRRTCSSLPAEPRSCLSCSSWAHGAARGHGRCRDGRGRRPAAPHRRVRSVDQPPRDQIQHHRHRHRRRRLNRKLRDGSAKLEFDEKTGYLKSVLDLLKIPVESQVLVYTQTSLQAQHITMANPRAIYFNDKVSVGYIRGAGLLEIVAQDREAGIDLLRRCTRRRRAQRDASAAISSACAVTCRGTRSACPA